MKLLLADDHSLFRDALVQYIERAEPDATVLLARDVHEVMEIMNGKPGVDLILLDMRMPGMNGLQGLGKLRESYPGVRMALISGTAEKQDVERAMAMGASGYFPKTLSGQALMKGIAQILKGENYIATDHNTGEIMPSYYGMPPVNDALLAPLFPIPEGTIKLTPREKEVLGFLMRGESNKDIARALDLQIVTIKLHIRGICRKLGAKNRTQAALIARERGL